MKIKTVITRYRGDGRVIKQELPIIDEKPYLQIDFESVEARMTAARQLGKSAALGAMYGMTRRWDPKPRAGENGPFTVTARPSRKKKPYKVVNKHGLRVHAGSWHSCKDVCDRLNVQYAKYLMLRDDDGFT